MTEMGRFAPSTAIVLAALASWGPLQPGCAHRIASPAEIRAAAERYDLPRARVRRDWQGIQVAEQARDLLGAAALVVDGETHRYDCSGLVDAAYAGAGVDLHGLDSRGLFELARAERVLHRRRRPAPGDVAFFDNTHDRNGNRRLDDRLTHVAVVERVEDDGTIVLVHKGGSGVTRIVMNLRHRRLRADDGGKELNSTLRGKTRRDRRRTRYLSGELWRAFASLWRVRPAEDDGSANTD